RVAQLEGNSRKRTSLQTGVAKTPSFLPRGLAHRLTSVDTPICQAQIRDGVERMRCMAMAARVRWCVLLAGVYLFAGAPSALARERVTCVMIRTDETGASVAKRVTGDARNMQASWFQIVNPTTSRPVPKTR